MSHRTFLLLIPALAVLSAGCATDDPIDVQVVTHSTTAESSTDQASDGDTPTTRPTSGPSTPTCVNGWTTPAADGATFTAGVDLVSASLGTNERLAVEDFRYFTGPDSPGIVDPRHEQVEHWYIRAHLESDSSSGARFLVTRRDRSGGVEAIAPYDTHDWNSPDWSGFEGDGPPATYPDLPGTWGSVRYDFVTGNGGSGNPGLPPENEGCLAGT
jgi:hypothetical protein